MRIDSDKANTITSSSPHLLHPWHGIDPICEKSEVLAYIENTPISKIKYELDAASGLLCVDHGQQSSALPPAAYGFIPRTLCGSRVAQLNSRLRGDLSALDVFVLSERPIEFPGVLARTRIIGVIPVRDETYVDDKLIAVLNRDAAFGTVSDISELPIYHLERISHFLAQESFTSVCEVGDADGSIRANALLKAALADYVARFGDD